MPFISMTHFLYSICQDLLLHENMKVLCLLILGGLLLHDFNEHLPPYVEVKKELENHNMFFMTFGLYGLP